VARLLPALARHDPDCLDPQLLELVEPLRVLAPPARVLDKTVLLGLSNPRLARALRRRGIETLIVTRRRDRCVRRSDGDGRHRSGLSRRPCRPTRCAAPAMHPRRPDDALTVSASASRSRPPRPNGSCANGVVQAGRGQLRPAFGVSTDGGQPSEKAMTIARQEGRACQARRRQVGPQSA